MTRRVWRHGDPDPGDAPDLADSHGGIWRWEEPGSVFEERGWWTPTGGAPRAWAELFADDDATVLSELLPGEFDEIAGQMVPDE